MKILLKLKGLDCYSLKLDLKMKLTIYLFLFSLFQIYASTYSQNAKITLNMSNVAVEDVLKEIEYRTEFNVLYNDNELDYNRVVSVNVKDELVTNLLKNIFKNTHIKHKTIGKQIVLVKEVSESIDQQIQNLKIKGIVTDESGMPVPGVNIIVKGTNKGVITDFDGNYSITVKNTDAVLLFSYIGFKDKEIVVGNQTTINIVLEENLSELDEVVLVGYGTVKKSDVTGSLSSVAVEDIVQTPNVNLARAIQGRATGVSVTKSSGTPGATPTIRIRGIGTVRNADPLYIVDGVPINDITNVNMADAASIEVLKDASATAIYGSRGANGVILIQTKKGKQGQQPSVSYSTYFGAEKRIDNIDLLSAEQWATLHNEAKVNDGNEPQFDDPSSVEGYNWKDAVYRAGIIQNHQLSVSGSSDKSSYYLSLGHVSQTGIIKNSEFERTNFRINNTYIIKPKIKLGHNIQYSVAKRVTIPEAGNNPWNRAGFAGYVIEPNRPIYNDDGSLTNVKTAFSPAINTLSLIKYGQRPRTREAFLGNVFLEADLLEGLKFRSSYGLEINNTKVDFFIEEFDAAPTYEGPSRIDANRAESRVSIWTNTLNYDTTIAKKHSVNALLGQEFQKNENNNVNAGRTNIPESIPLPTLSSGDVTTVTNAGNVGESALSSVFGRLNYNFDDKYLFTGTYRIDGSSNFNKDNRWAHFPSLALGWNIHNETFFKADAVSQLKLRLGWGEVGNQGIPGTARVNTLESLNYSFGDGEVIQTGIAPERPGNPTLKWETTVSTNIGVDVALFKNALTLSADYFIKNTTDLLLQGPVLQTSGFEDNPFVNAGDIENKGLELELNYKQQINDFFFSVGGNISFIDNKVLELADEGSSISSGNGIGRTEAGHPLASFYGYEIEGVFQNQDEVDNSPIFSGTKVGDLKYRDLNNDGKINAKDRTFIGSPFADFTYGFNLDMKYKNFDFSAFFQGSQGNDIYNNGAVFLEANYDTNSSTAVLDRWTGEGTSNTRPRATLTSKVNTQQSERFVKDGSYLRLKNIQLGYNIPEDLLKKISVNNLRIYVAAQNVLTFTKYDGLDPEIGVDLTRNDPLDIGIDRGRYPSTRTFTMGLDINF